MTAAAAAETKKEIKTWKEAKCDLHAIATSARLDLNCDYFLHARAHARYILFHDSSRAIDKKGAGRRKMLFSTIRTYTLTCECRNAPQPD